MARLTPSGALLLVTGAGGFLGGEIVAAALAAGCRVRAIVRRAKSADNAAWRESEHVEIVEIDLTAPDARTRLDAALDGVAAVAHAAAASGGDAAHAAGTVAATETLIGAMTTRPSPPRLALVSSLAVYNYASMPVGATLDETTPLEPEPALRDAYCRAKLAQEALALRAAQAEGLAVRALRPGAVLGPGRLRTARLGVALGPMLLMPGGRAPIPAIPVDLCAALIVAAAFAPPFRSDAPVLHGEGWFEAINLVGPSQPEQAAYAAMLAPSGWPRATIRAPLALARAPARALALAGLVMPRLARRAPGLLRLETFDARFKPLRFSTARAEDRLGMGSDGGLAAALGLAEGEAATDGRD